MEQYCIGSWNIIDMETFKYILESLMNMKIFRYITRALNMKEVNNSMDARIWNQL